MQAAIDRLEFAPPQPPGRWRAFVLAILAHLLLMLALTWGINWNRESENSAAEAELWASVPQQAAPRLVEAPPIPPAPAPEPPAQKAAPTPPPPPAPRQADIALEREKMKEQLAQQRQQELERQKKLEARKKQEDLKRQEVADKKAAEDKKKKDELVKAAKAKKEQLEDEKRLAVLRQENLDRMMKGIPAGTGAPTSTGSAQRAAGPSPSYAGRIAARIKPNIVFTDTVSGNPAAEVQIRVAPDGTIVGRKLITSSGVKSWDEAVLRAIDKTEVLPKDIDGTVVPEFPVRFRPHD